MILVASLIGISASNLGKSVSFGIVFESVRFVKSCKANGIGSLRFKVAGLLVYGLVDELTSEGWKNTLFR